MWIRSQNEDLLINVEAVKKGINNEIYGWASGRDFNIGRYETPEEVLKVLDMIQNHNTGVFQMPLRVTD